MACNIERPEPQELFDHYKGLFESTVLQGGAVIPESNEWYAVSLQYAMAEQFYAITEEAWKQRDARQACAENLEAQAADEGVYPRPAVPAQGYLKLTGTAGSALPSPMIFTVAGTKFVTANDATQPTQISDEGTAIVRVRSLTPGAAGNISQETGTIDSVPDGVERTVEVCGGTFCEGEDAETTEAFRQRFISRKQYTPNADVNWLQEKLQEWPCATRAILRQGSCCGCGCEEQIIRLGSQANECADCGCEECGGKMHFYLMFDGSFDNGIAPISILQEVENWAFGSPQGFGLGQAPMGICGRIVPVTGVQVNAFLDLVTCPTSTELTLVRNTVSEFFQTVEPSQPLTASELEATIGRLLGGVDVSVRFELVNTEDGYGNGTPYDEDVSKVYVGGAGCSLEPDCDYMLILNELNISNASSLRSGCP